MNGGVVGGGGGGRGERSPLYKLYFVSITAKL